MRFIETPEYTFDDVVLGQLYSDIFSRNDVDFTPKSPLSTTIPIISSNMNSVTGKRMAEKLARLGGLGVLPQDMSLERVLNIIEYVHNVDINLDTPLTLTTEDRVMDATSIINKKSHQVIVIIDKYHKPIGVIKEGDLIGHDDHTKIKDITYSKAIIANKGISDSDAYNIMDDNRISSLPIVDNRGILVGILTKKDSLRNDIYKPALNKSGRLDLAVALSVNGYKDKIESIVKAGINTIFLDTAHGYTKQMGDAIKDVKDRYNEIIIVAGNVMSGEGVEHLINSGADGVKVGIGPGAMCTTRMMTGVGRPQFSAIMETAEQARKMGGFIIADGGIKYPRDLALSIAGGATHGMIGTRLAGTYESPGDVKENLDGKYKENWGMASGKAVTSRNKELSRFEQAKRERFQEGISRGKIYDIKPLGDFIDKYMTGVLSAMTYAGARTLEEFFNKAIVRVQTQNGFNEGTPHGRSIK